MANVVIRNGSGTTRYLKATGGGEDNDPHIPEHLESNSAAILAAAQAVETAVEGTLTVGLPTGASTAALQTTGNASLATLAGAVTGTEVQVDVLTSALPTGASTAANQTTLIGHVDGIEALLTTIDADTSALAAAVSTEMQVDVVAALPAGDNNIGNVDIASALPAGTNNIGDVDVLSIAAGENLVGLVGASDIVVTVTPTLDTNAYGSGDLLFDSTEVANAVRVNGTCAVLQSVTIIDKADQGVAFTLLIADTNTDWGTLNSAPDADDTEVATMIGWVPIATGDYVDLGGAKVACVRNIGLTLKAGAATTSLYVAGLNGSGTPTFGASDLVIKLGFLRS